MSQVIKPDESEFGQFFFLRIITMPSMDFAHRPKTFHNAETSADALVQAFVMIVVSEIGDKTFLIAAIMATRHPRITVFGGAFASLVVMSVLSAALGRVILGLIPKVSEDIQQGAERNGYRMGVQGTKRGGGVV